MLRVPDPPDELPRQATIESILDAPTFEDFSIRLENVPSLVINGPAPGRNKLGRTSGQLRRSSPDSYALHDPKGNVLRCVFPPPLFRLYAVSILARPALRARAFLTNGRLRPC